MARLLLILAACRCGAAERTDTPDVSPAVATPAPTPSGVSGIVPGACEASALVWVDGHFVIGDNEIKRSLPGMTAEGAPGPALALADTVDDIEALVAAPGGVWVVGSQGRKNNGEADPERQRILWTGGGPAVSPVLTGCAPCAAAAARGPEAGGVNVEGAFLADAHLWLGLRSPLVDGKALVIALDTPANGPAPGAPQVTQTLLLDLGGLGIRDVSPAPEGGHYLLAGASDGARRTFRLFRWAGPGSTPVPLEVAVPDGVEGISVAADGTLTYVTDGDGKKPPCAVPSTWGRIRVPAGP